MKKSLLFVLVLIIVCLSACTNSTNKMHTTQPHSTQESITAAAESTLTTENQQKSEVSSTKATKAAVSQQNTSSEKISTQSVQTTLSDAPYILDLKISDLKRIKAAAETMSEGEFDAFLEEEYVHERMNGLNTIEDAETHLSNLENTPVLLIDNDPDNFEIQYYVDSGMLDYRVTLDDGNVLRCTTYLEEHNSKPDLTDSEYMQLIGVQEYANFKVEFCRHKIRDNGDLVGYISFDNSYTIFRAYQKTPEEMAEILPRISIHTVGELIER
ncbi:MAG: hypothetical protein IJC37_04880 [Clostridia bacterium]|nr:hypothetical protein [Clostridia bacterium]